MIGPISTSGSACRVSEPTLLEMLTIRGDAERRSSGSIALVTRMTPIDVGLHDRADDVEVERGRVLHRPVPSRR